MSKNPQRIHSFASASSTLLTLMLFLGLSLVSAGCGGGGSSGGGGGAPAPAPAPSPSPTSTTLLASMQSNISVTTDTSHQVNLPGSVLVTSASGPNGETPPQNISVSGTGLHIRVNNNLFQNSDVSRVTVQSGDKVQVYVELPPGRSPDPKTTVQYTVP